MAKIKICGLFRECDIDYVNEAKPDFAGFIIDFPRSHRSIDRATLAALRKRLSRDIKAVGVFVNADVRTVAGLLNEDIIDYAQLHGGESAVYINELKKLTCKPVIKSFVMGERGADADTINGSPADLVMLDGGRGEGKPFERSLIKSVKRDFFLAGGLTPQNIGEVIRTYSPYAVDISSGVETDKFKDSEKIRRAVAAARGDKQ